MVFSSITFIYFFLPVVILLYYLTKNINIRNIILLASSLVFYYWGEQNLTILFIVSILLGYTEGIIINRTKQYKKLNKAVFIISISIHIIILAYYKYSNFIVGSINSILNTDITIKKIALPIGISFFTFQILSYIIDVYRGDVEVQRDIIKFATYVSMFPQLVAGPIVRYSDINKQLANREHSIAHISKGITRFIIGLAKKVLLANSFGELCQLYRNSTNISMLYAWLYMISFTLQIYYDFSGYSDMAIGLGQIFGFDFLENFNYPYMSRSITEFWRRWHISLGSWFRDYVYIPLGGNRKGQYRQIINILIVWGLTGLWHGAAWNFVIWGIYFGIILIIEKKYTLQFIEKHRIFGHIYTLLIVSIGFVIFNTSSLNELAVDFSRMLGQAPIISRESIYYLSSYITTLIIGVIGVTSIPKKIYKKYINNDIVETILDIIALIVITAYLVDGSFNPFLYFRF